MWPGPSRGLSGSSQVDAIAQAIAQMEGYNSPGSLAQRNNNPGNLRSGPGQIGTSSGFAVFASPDDGFAALNNQIQLNASRGLTLNQFFAGLPGVYAGYAPSSDANNPAQYASFVSGQTGIDPNTPLDQVLSGAAGPPAASSDTGSVDSSSPDSSAPTGDSLATVGILAAAGLAAVYLLS